MSTKPAAGQFLQASSLSAGQTIGVAGVALYRFATSLRGVEDMLAERGIDTTYETVTCSANMFGPAIPANIRRRRGRADSVWHLDEVIVRINRKRTFMWRAVDKEGEVLDVLVQNRRNKSAALKLLWNLFKNQAFVPAEIVTNDLASYKAAIRDLGCTALHKPGRLHDDNRLENSHLPVRRRERKMQRLKSQGGAQRFTSTPSAIYNTRVVFETRPLSVWFYHAVTLEGLPAICIDARHAKARSMWRATRPMRTTQKDSRISPKLA